MVDDNGEARRGRRGGGRSCDPALPPRRSPWGSLGPRGWFSPPGGQPRLRHQKRAWAQVASRLGIGVRGDPSSWWPLGFNPMWEETLVFTVHMPEIALVRFLVWDHDPIGRDFIGQRTLAFSSMMPGRRGLAGWGGAASPMIETYVPCAQAGVCHRGQHTPHRAVPPPHPVCPPHHRQCLP